MSRGLLIRELPDTERPRERLVAEGPEKMSNSDLLAILLRTGTKGASAIQVGQEILREFKNLDNLSRATVPQLRRIKGIGRDKAVTLVAAFTLARKMARELQHEGPLLDSPEAVARLMREEIRVQQVEAFHVLLVNTRRRLISIQKIADGTLDTILVHPREVFKPAIAANAAAIILLHNHPSGDPTPSEADVKVTRDLVRAGQLLKIDVLDHIVLGRATEQRQIDHISLRELGYFAGS